MSKTKTTICFSIILSSISLMSHCFAGPRSAQHLNNDIYLLKMGAAGINSAHSNVDIAPSIGLAKRFEINDAAIEVSMNYAGLKDSSQSLSQWSLPKVTYLMFHNSSSENSIYYGGGLSWSKIKQKNNSDYTKNVYFEGVFLEGTAGYEIHRAQKIRTTIELNVSQPLVASSYQGSQPGPSVFANIGFGFF